MSKLETKNIFYWITWELNIIWQLIWIVYVVLQHKNYHKNFLQKMWHWKEEVCMQVLTYFDSSAIA